MIASRGIFLSLPFFLYTHLFKITALFYGG